MTFHPGSPPQKRIKGKPDGSAVKGKTGKPWVAKIGLVPVDATGHNNSSLTLILTSVNLADGN
jgi:hypothetical protein